MKNTNPNANHRNPFAQACWFHSPSHAWLSVPKELLKRFNLESKISSHSYQIIHPDGTPIVFLEEDYDATLLIQTIGLNLYKIADGNGWIQTHSIGNNFFLNSKTACSYK